MCGIVGFVGSNESVPVLLDGLKLLRYRGYDSARSRLRAPTAAFRFRMPLQ